MRRFSLIALLAVGLAGCAQLAAPELPPPPAGYRLSHYRAPTPAELPGAQRVDARQLAARLQAAPRPCRLQNADTATTALTGMGIFDTEA